MKILTYEKAIDLLKHTKGEEVAETLPETGWYDEDVEGVYTKKKLPKDIFADYDIIESGVKAELQSFANSIANPKELIEDFVELKEITGVKTFKSLLIKKDIVKDVIVPEIEELNLTTKEKEAIKGKESWYQKWTNPYKIVIKTTKGDYEVVTEVMAYDKERISVIIKENESVKNLPNIITLEEAADNLKTTHYKTLKVLTDNGYKKYTAKDDTVLFVKGEHKVIEVEKTKINNVGLFIGKGGKNIKDLQNEIGAKIKLI